MGHIKEPNGVTLVVDKKILTSDMEKRIKEFIKKSKEKNKNLLDKLNSGVL
jgi:hypothetical protein